MLDNCQIAHNIERYKDVIRKEKQEITDKELIVDSLTESLVKEVKRIVLPYSEKMLFKSWEEQKKKTKAERSTYEFIKQDMIERFFHGDKNAKLEEVISVGYESRQYNFYFTYHGIHLEIAVPNLKVVDKENVIDVHYGQYAVYYKSKPSHWDLIICSYDEEEIARAIEEFVDTYTNK